MQIKVDDTVSDGRQSEFRQEPACLLDMPLEVIDLVQIMTGEDSLTMLNKMMFTQLVNYKMDYFDQQL